MPHVELFDKSGEKPVRRVIINTTGEVVPLEFIVKNTSNIVVRNLHIELPGFVQLKEPEVFPRQLIPGEEFKLGLSVNAIETVELSPKILYNFLEVKME